MMTLIMIAGFAFFVVLSFLGTWLIRGRGLGELWPWGRAARTPSGLGATPRRED